MQNTGIDLIAQRRAAIEEQRKRLQDELARLDAEQAQLAAEEQELQIAERVLGRLVASTPAPSAAPRVRVRLAQSTGVSSSIPRAGTKRPEGIPTTRAMVETLLTEAERGGKEGLLGREIVLGISERWWPGVGWNDVLPTVLRLTKRGYFGRKGQLFVRVHQHQTSLMETG